MGNQLLVHLPGKLQLADHLVLRLAGGGGLQLVIRLTRRTCHQSVCREGLKLDQIGSGLCCSFNQLPCRFDATVVVDACFGDDQSCPAHHNEFL